MQIFSYSSLNIAVVIGLPIGMLYMFGFIYYIYKKFLSLIFEDLMCMLDNKENEETYRPILYSLLNSLSLLILAFMAAFSSQTQLGIATIIGSDMFNIFFVIGYVFTVYKDGNHGTLDPWQMFRDIIVYAIGLITVILFLVLNFITIWSGLILLGFYLMNFLVLNSDKDIKKKVMLWLGFTDENDEFNSDDHFLQKKRRESIHNLMETNCVDLQETSLQRKLNRMNALLVLKFGNQDHPQVKVNRNFQKLVYIVIFALRNQAKIEKQKRSEYYQSLYNKAPKKAKKREDDKKSENENQKEDKDEIKPLSNNQHENEQLMENEKEEHVNQEDQYQPKNDEDYDADEHVSLKMPPGKLDKVLFVLFFPVHLILFVMPNYLHNTQPKKLVLCLLLNIMLLIGIFFIIDWWSLEFSLQTNIQISVVGVVFVATGISIHFMSYNFQVASEEKQLEFLQSFLQMGIFRTGVCIGLPLLIKGIVTLSQTFPFATTSGMGITIVVFAALLFILLIMGILSRFKMEAKEGQKLMILYFAALIGSVVILTLLK